MPYEPQEDSFLLQKYAKKLAKGTVLDIGTGSGIQAETASKNKSVKKVLAVDTDKYAIDYCKKNIINKKIKFQTSDLFTKIKGAFDTIIFNPPYLPQENEQKYLALEGGKKGYEIIERFLAQASNFLKPNGIILIVFSSLTKKQKVDELIEKNLLKFKELEKQHIFFEDLYVYKIQKSNERIELEKKKITNIRYLAKGKRGNVFTGNLRNKKIAIKIKKKQTKAQKVIENEARTLKLLQKYQISPKFLFKSKNYLVYEFIKGEYLKDWIKTTDKKQVKKLKELLIKILKICNLLDKLKITKEEMHRPWKHIIIKNSTVKFIDFERAHSAKKPHNVTQFLNFIRILLSIFKIKYNKEMLIRLGREYKEIPNNKNFQKILNWVKTII